MGVIQSIFMTELRVNKYTVLVANDTIILMLVGHVLDYD
jgi:hypothetical protein